MKGKMLYTNFLVVDLQVICLPRARPLVPVATDAGVAFGFRVNCINTLIANCLRIQFIFRTIYSIYESESPQRKIFVKIYDFSTIHKI